MLGYMVAKVCASPRSSIWFTRLFLLVRDWGLGTRLQIFIDVIQVKIRYGTIMYKMMAQGRQTQWEEKMKEFQMKKIEDYM